MKATIFKKEFKSRLSELYAAHEINSLFDWVFEEITGTSRLNLVLNPLSEISAGEEKKLEEALKRLENREPVQYILGKTEFYGLLFNVDSQVLIPRPETEELVNWVVEDLESESDLRILDIGTGSGCIAISLAKSLDAAQVSALDVSKTALEKAAENASLNQVKVEFIEDDIVNPVNFKNSVDIIVSNPPYVRELEKQHMEAKVLDYEPHLALFVKDDDALLFYRKILEYAQHYLSAGGLIYFEINEYLKSDLETLFAEFGISEVKFKKDMYGKTRMVKLKGLPTNQKKEY